MPMPQDGVPFKVCVRDLVEKILALYPDGVPPHHQAQMKSIIEDLSVLSGIIGALQSTAGYVFCEHAKGNTDIADTFYEALLAINVPQPKKRSVPQ